MTVESRVVTVAHAVGVDRDGRTEPLAARAIGRAVVPRGGAGGEGGGLVPVSPVQVLESRIRVRARKHEVVRRDEPLAVAVVDGDVLRGTRLMPGKYRGSRGKN